MRRYIDEDRLYSNIEEKYKVAQGDAREAYNDVLDTICEIPTADVQEVIRCKDCKYSCEEKPVFGITDYSCIKLGIHCLDANDFCSYGAKMDEEES